MLKAIKDIYKKAEASVVVQNLIGIQIKNGIFEPSLSAKDIAGEMIQSAWDFKPDLLGGRFGTRPHKISVAAFSVAFSIVLSDNEEFGSLSKYRDAYLLMFASIINELEVNGRLYKLTETDNVILELAVRAVEPIMEGVKSHPGAEGVDSLTRALNEREYTWDEWYRAFVVNACSVEGSGLVQGKDGLSLIDIMDHEPLRRAHRDGICPVRHGISFANNFDITKFGM